MQNVSVVCTNKLNEWNRNVTVRSMVSRRRIKFIFFYVSIGSLLLYCIFHSITWPTLQESEIDTSKQYLLTVGVLSKLSAVSRRTAIRETWFKVCKENLNKVVCKFFTDSVGMKLPKKKRKSYLQEEEKYGDLIFMPYKGKILVSEENLHDLFATVLMRFMRWNHCKAIVIIPNSTLNIFLSGRIRAFFKRFDFCSATSEPHPKKVLLIEKCVILEFISWC